MRRLLALMFVLFAATGCGVPAEQDAVGSDSTDASSTTTTTATTTATTGATTTTATELSEMSSTTAANPEDKWWLLPSSDPPNLRLTEARRFESPDCGMTECALTTSTATLVYDSGEPTIPRMLRIVQSSPRQFSDSDAPVADPLDTAPERVAGDRRVRVAFASDTGPPYLEAAWTEPNGDAVRIDSLGISWEDLATIIESLRPTNPATWPVVLPPAVEDCVDAHSQLAPVLIPDGWQRFVLQAQPTGTCGQHPFLMMSLVLPGTADGPGKLVTIVTSSLGAATPQPGEPVEINGYLGSVVRSTMADGTATVSISIVIDSVAVDAHGNADESELRDIVASIRPLDDSEWADLVKAVQQVP